MNAFALAAFMSLAGAPVARAAPVRLADWSEEMTPREREF